MEMDINSKEMHRLHNKINILANHALSFQDGLFQMKKCFHYDQIYNLLARYTNSCYGPAHDDLVPLQDAYPGFMYAQYIHLLFLEAMEAEKKSQLMQGENIINFSKFVRKTEDSAITTLLRGKN
jgi:hypothetical protein